MTQFQITGGFGYVKDGRVYEEHPKFGRYKTPFVTWVCLVTGERQSKYYALSNLQEVVPVRHTVVAVDMGIEFTCAMSPADSAATQLEANIHATAMGFIFEATKAQTKRMSERKLYLIELNARINSALTEPKPLTIEMPRDLMVNIREALYCNVRAA